MGMPIELPTDDHTGFKPADSLHPAAFPHPVWKLGLRETNLSWIVLTGPYAYKIKKCIAFSFVDQSTLERRKTLCEEELRLNQRLAGSLYEAVIPLTRLHGKLTVGGQGTVVDYAVKMKQFDATQELAALLQAQAVDGAELADLGGRLADFHRSLPKPDGALDFHATQQLHDAVLGSLATVLCHLDEGTRSADPGALVDWIHDFFHESSFFLRRRERDGHIRECHGDLHARNIVRWDGQLTPYDSLEFDPKLRWIDTMNDVAFLFMDLKSHDRCDLAFDFLNAYLARTGDYDGVRLLTFYAIYRALIRAMVDLLSAENLPGRDAYRQRARLRLKTASDLLAATGPSLIIMHGLSGSGKSFTSALLAQQLGGVLIRSDVERRRLQIESGAAAIHTEEFDQLTYDRLLEGAASCLLGGLSTIVDAAFLEACNRDRFEKWADSRGFPFIIVACEAELTELESRIERRQRLGIDPSDAGLAILHRQLRTRMPIGPGEESRVVTIDTMQRTAVEDALPRLKGMMQQRDAAERSPLRKPSDET